VAGALGAGASTAVRYGSTKSTIEGLPRFNRATKIVWEEDRAIVQACSFATPTKRSGYAGPDEEGPPVQDGGKCPLPSGVASQVSIAATLRNTAVHQSLRGTNVDSLGDKITAMPEWAITTRRQATAIT